MMRTLKNHTLSLLILLFFMGLPALSSANFCAQQLQSSITPSESRPRLSQALLDPIVEQGRALKLYDDYKYLADLSPRDLSLLEIGKIKERYEKSTDKKEATKFYIESLYEHKKELLPSTNPEVRPTWTIRDSSHKPAFDHTEKMWSVLARRTPKKTKSSLIPSEHDILIPGARFQEGYYWDTFFAFSALLKTNRVNLVRGQIENYLSQIHKDGYIRNANRDYYERSQPPVISQMIRLYLEHEMSKGMLTHETLKWMTEKVYPLLKKDYFYFWMNKNTRYSETTGLNNFYDALNTPRPERHSSDIEEEIAVTYRDVRAGAEFGKDFTDSVEGETTQYNTLLQNSLLYQYEKDLNWMAKLVGQNRESQQFEAAAERRKFFMNKFMWDPKRQTFMDYNKRTKKLSPIMTADIFLPLYVGLATPEQAAAIMRQLPALERAGGLMASETGTGKQWDAPYGWAPQHYFAIQGMRNYKFNMDAHRLALKFVTTVDRIYSETGKIIEKIDAVTGGVPTENGDKYPTQDGFLWTNGVYIWCLTEVLGFKLIPQ